MTVTAIRAPLTAEQLEVLGFMLGDALTEREPRGTCRDCTTTTCPDHAADWDRCDDYRDIAAQLGIEQPS